MVGGNERMLAMPEVNYIKHLRENEDLNISEISRKIGVDWRTAKKYADGEVPDPALPDGKGGMMYTEGFGMVVDDWLEEDLLLKRKLRRNNKKIFEKLRDEHKFNGSYRTVCQYIFERKPLIRVDKKTRYERLEHPKGEAQVDFGTMQAVWEGEYKEIKSLILSFPYSNAGFCSPMPAENSECFLEGLKQLFKQAGGVPTALRIDNLSAAVISIGKGHKRVYTDAFLRFQAHYGFEVQACNPSSGHEKGNVEKKVGYTRSNFFVIEPIMDSFEQLATWVEEEMKKDRKRPHYEKKFSIEELWEDENKSLKALPDKELSIYTIDQATTNKYGEITIDQDKVLIPNANIKKQLAIKKEWNQFTCFTKDGEIIYQEQRPYMSKTKPIPWIDIFEHWRFKTRAVRHSRYFKFLPESVQTYLNGDHELIKRRVNGITELLKKEYTLLQIDELFQEKSRLKHEPHEIAFFLEAKSFSLPERFSEIHTPTILINQETDLHRYDRQLCPSIGGGAR